MVAETEEGGHSDTFTRQEDCVRWAGSALIMLGSPTGQARVVTDNDIENALVILKRVVARA